MTTRELAIARTVVYAGLFDYPLTLEQLQYSLIGSEQSAEEIRAVYDGSARLHAIVGCRDGFFFPAGRDHLICERRRREARAQRFLQQHRRMLRWLCAVPFTRLVALSGSIAHLNLEADGDLDLFVVTRGRRVWMVTLAMLVIAKLVGQRRIVCVNFVVADSHLGLEQQDLFTANQALHLKPLIGALLVDALFAANPFIGHWYPNSARRPHSATLFEESPIVVGLKRVVELLLWAPSPLIEAGCRRLYAAHLRRRAGSWRSPDQVQLQSDYLKLHTQSHRHSVLDRFDAAMEAALDCAEGNTASFAAAAGRR
jgi:hypothetical protein